MKSKSDPTCYACGQAISFDPKIRSENGKFIPLNRSDNSKHDCPKSPYNKRKKKQKEAD